MPPRSLETVSVINNATNRYILDTNIFNRALDGYILPALFTGSRLFATAIQRAELKATKNLERKDALLTIFSEIDPTLLPASSFAFDIEGAGWGEAHWNDGSGTFDKMLDRLKALDCKSERLQKNQTRDILIAETAIKNEAIMVSEDHNLRTVVSEFGGRAIPLSELLFAERFI